MPYVTPGHYKKLIKSACCLYSTNLVFRYVNTALGLCGVMESCIKQNNAIEIYEVSEDNAK